MRAHRKSKASERKMQLALTSSNRGIWDYKIDENQLYEDRICKELGYDTLSPPFEAKQHLRLIHPDDFPLLEPQWQNFIMGNIDNIDFSYQMLSKSGKWNWYRDVGRVIERDAQGKPTRVSGIYTNITQSKVSEANAILFGEAFSKINDWVLILDSKGMAVTANSAFLKTFLLDDKSLVPSFKDYLKALGQQQFKKFKRIMSKL